MRVQQVLYVLLQFVTRLSQEEKLCEEYSQKSYKVKRKKKKAHIVFKYVRLEKKLFCDCFFFDNYFQVCSYVFVQFDGNREFAQSFQRLVQLNLAAIHI